MSQLSGDEILAFRSVAASAENDAIAARQNTDLLAQAYITLQVENLRLTEQRDELLAAIEPLAELCDQLCRWDRRFDDVLDAVDAAIASVKGQS